MYRADLNRIDLGLLSNLKMLNELDLHDCNMKQSDFEKISKRFLPGTISLQS